MNTTVTSVIRKEKPNWSDLPRDIVECLIQRLLCPDRIRIRAVCKAWSFHNRHIPPTIDKLPWSLHNDRIHGECRVVDPLSRTYATVRSARWKECQVFLDAFFYKSTYGWLLIEKKKRYLENINSEFPNDLYFLYSPFTDEVIKLPYLGYPKFYGAINYSLDARSIAFSLNATSPKCDIFDLVVDYSKRNVYVMLYTVGDCSTKFFKFNSVILTNKIYNFPTSTVYADGVFYCLFAQGELGAFNVELKEWSMLTTKNPSDSLFSLDSRLVVLDANICLWFQDRKALYRFDFSKGRWVYENDLDNHVLFVGTGTCFAARAVGETSQLANYIFSCESQHRGAVGYRRTSSRDRKSQLYRKCKRAAEQASCWIEPPSGGIWRANDLINAGKLNILQSNVDDARVDNDLSAPQVPVE